MRNNIDLQWFCVTMVLLVAVIGFGGYALMTGKHLEAITVIITALLLRLGTMLDYKYGSSEGSAKKTDLLAKGQGEDKTIQS